MVLYAVAKTVVFVSLKELCALQQLAGTFERVADTQTLTCMCAGADLREIGILRFYFLRAGIYKTTILVYYYF